MSMSESERTTGPCPALDCQWVIDHLQAFLHDELGEEQANAFRHHIDACDDCMEQADIESTISHLLHRCYPPAHVSETLRAKVGALGVTL